MCRTEAKLICAMTTCGYEKNRLVPVIAHKILQNHSIVTPGNRATFLWSRDQCSTCYCSTPLMQQVGVQVQHGYRYGHRRGTATGIQWNTVIVVSGVQL